MVPGKGLAGIWISVVGLVVIALTLFGFLYGQALPWWITPLWIVIIVAWYLVARAVGGGREEGVVAAEKTA